METETAGDVKKPRQVNMELLRCIAMMMVVALHYLGKGELLADPAKAGEPVLKIVAWIPEILCIAAVNLYMLLSGYFGTNSSFRLSKLIRLYLQIWFYSAVIGFCAFLVWGYPKDTSGTYFFLKLLFPISMEHYWFLTAYFYLYLLLPLVGVAVRRLSRDQMKITLAVLFGFFCIVKSLLPVRLEMDRKGYDVLWYLCMYLLGSYLGRWGFGRKCGWGGDDAERRKGIFLFLAGAVGSMAELFGLHWFYVRTGKLGMLVPVSTEYNHLFVVLEAVGLFWFFCNLKPAKNSKMSNLILRISPYTLGVYLLHENIDLRYRWQSWLMAERADSIPALFLWLIVAVATVFTVGILTDLLRSFLEKTMHRMLCRIPVYRRLTEKVKAVDEVMRIRAEQRN